MEHFGAGGSWGMIPNMEPHSNPATPPNQDHLFLPQQQQPQFNHHQQQFQQQFNPQPPQSQPQPRFQNQPPPPATQQQHQHQSLASHFHLLHLVENLADVTENGTRDQQADALVAELNTQFEKCQQLLNSIGGTIKAKSTTVGEQKRKLEETENLLAQRRFALL
ncbi:Mediator of RNA polymerase II transcription subunit 9 [Striga hermonthica]|uniref:Mediator of RNA polymerase II transcription subunit 9 n=1 Tax=Striga hermonthica TaxID=68872 RepID=A0A9N7N0J5_STRHE|nr:Mediator of RNA polymerase II transcription subunit 9 [Striga hermonthica]